MVSSLLQVFREGVKEENLLRSENIYEYTQVLFNIIQTVQLNLLTY